MERYLKLFTFLPLDADRRHRWRSTRASPDEARGADGAGARGDEHRARRGRRAAGDPDQLGSLAAGAVTVRYPPRRWRRCPSAGCPRPDCRRGPARDRGARGQRPGQLEGRRAARHSGQGVLPERPPIDSVELRIDEDSLQGPPEARFVILRKGKKNYVRLVIEPLAITSGSAWPCCGSAWRPAARRDPAPPPAR